MSTMNSHKRCQVQLHKNHNFKQDGTQALAKAYSRYGIKNVKNGFLYAKQARNNTGMGHRNAAVMRQKNHTDQPGASGESMVPAQDVSQDMEYVCPVKIGTPGTTLNLDFDTGSADLWVWSSELRHAKNSMGNHNIYNPKQSSTAQSTNGTWQITYGDESSASGDVHNDDIMLGQMKIPQQAIELAKDLSAQFLGDSGSDGLLGLAFGKINTVKPQQVRTPMENMMNSSLLESPIFTCKLMHNANGYYTFGGLSDEFTNAKIEYATVNNSEGFWEVPCKQWMCNGEMIPMDGGKAIVDTGTTLILIDDKSVEAFYSKIPGAKLDSQAGGYVFPANATLPQCSFPVGDCQITMDPKTLSYGTQDSNGMVFGSIQSSGDLGMAILGDRFIMNCYCVFDQGKMRLGCAQRKNAN